MRVALREAERGRGRTRPNPIVGCVIVKSGVQVGKGFHARAGLPHAEVVALRAAGAAARGADVYVTLEPCNHTGRTGPCSEALIAAGVRRVIVGTLDPNPVVHGKGVRRLRQAGIAVDVGVLEDECRLANEAFSRFIRTRRPFVIAKLAQSLDGRVATRTGESRWITSDEARRAGHELRNECDAVIVGVGTVLADDPSLTCRVRGGRDPVRVVVDSLARTPPSAKVVRLARESAAPTWVVVSPRAPLARRRALERAGAEVLVQGGRASRVDLGRLLDELGRRELLSVLVEGGPTLQGGFFDAHLVDKVHAFVAPRIIGGAGALGAVGGEGAARLADAVRLEVVRTRWAGTDLAVVGYPRYR